MLSFSRYKDYVKSPTDMPSFRELERWMGTGQVAKRLGYSRQGTINLAEEGKIRAVKTGAGWIYDPDSVEVFKARLKGSKGER
jgi:excisionase family DNA binding protein